MTSTVVASTTAAAPLAPSPRPRAEPRLWRHVLGYAAVLAVVLAVVDLDAAFTVDEGSYALAVAALDDGTWALEPVLDAVDPGMDHEPYRSEVTATGRYPLGRSLGYIAALDAVTGVVGGPLGLHLLPAAGALLAAAAAWLLCVRLAPGAERWAFWVVALGPVLVNAPVLWAHSLNAAAAGFALAAWLSTRRPGPTAGAWLGLTAALAVGLVVRSEGVVTVAAVLIVAGGDALRRRSRGDLVRLAAVGMTCAAIWLAQVRFAGRITGGAGRARGEDGVADLAGRLSGAWHSLLAGAYSTPSAAALGAIGALVLAFGVWQLRRGERAAVVLVVAGAAVLAVRFALAPTDPVTGLLPACVAVGAALVGRAWTDRLTAERLVVAAMGLLTLGVAATQYAEGGGLEWGGRYFSALLVPGGVIAVIAVRSSLLPAARTLWPRVAPRAFVGVAMALSVVPTLFGLYATNALRTNHDAITAAVEDAGAEVAISTVPALPRLAWRTTPPLTWLAAADDEVDILVAEVMASGVERLVTYGPATVTAPPGHEATRLRPGLWLVTLAEFAP